MSAKLTQIALIVIVALTIYMGHIQITSRQSCEYLSKVAQARKIEQISKITPMNLQEKYQVAGALKASFRQFNDTMIGCEK